MGAIWTLALKDLRLLLRDKPGLFFALFFPILYAVFFGVVFSGGGGGDGAGIAVLVVDEDQTESSRSFVDGLLALDGMEARRADRETATARVRKGDATAYVVLPQGFGAASRRMLFGSRATLTIGVDPSRRAEAAMLHGLLTKQAFAPMRDPGALRAQVKAALVASAASGQDGLAMRPFLVALEQFLGNVVATTEANKTAGAEGSRAAETDGDAFGFQPLRIEQESVVRARRGPRNPFAITFPQGIVWGIMGCAAAFGISLVVERSQGTLARLLVSPLSQARILAGKGLACFLAVVSVSGVLLLVAVVGFSVRPDSWGLLALGIAANGIGFVGIMMLLSVVGKTEQSAGGIGWAVLMVMAMLGGGMIPLFAMPSWLRGVSSISPVKWAILSLEGALWRDFTLAEMLMPCAVMVAIGAVSFTAGTMIFRRTL